MKIYIHPPRERVVSTSSYTMTVATLQLYTKKGPLNLCEHPPFSQIKEVGFFTRGEHGYAHLRLTPQIKKAVLDFLNKHHGKGNQEYDCYSFVCKIFDIPEHDKYNLVSYWNIDDLYREPKVGDVIFLIDKLAHHFYHALVYIGKGLCLQVVERGGNLEISSFKDLKRDFQGANLILATPRS